MTSSEDMATVDLKLCTFFKCQNTVGLSIASSFLHLVCSGTLDNEMDLHRKWPNLTSARTNPVSSSNISANLAS